MSRRGRIALALLVACAATPVAAHDFWVQPDAYWLLPGAATAMTLQVGHGPGRMRSPIPLRRILRFEAIGPDGKALDLRPRLHLGGGAGDGDFAFGKPGAYVLVFQTDDQAQSHLPWPKFNDYVASEGVTPALEQRVRLHQMERDGSESYSRAAKSIVQVGQGGQASVTRRVGLPLEIVPERSPYALPRPAALPVRVFYRGRPLAGALVKLTHLEDDATPVEMHRTDRAGRTRFAMPSGGSWLLNVVWTRPQPRSAETDYETVFSSLSFGFPR